MVSEVIKNIEAEIDKQIKVVNELKLKLEKVKQESPEKLLAIQLHGMLCNYNHTDGCGWHYEIYNGVHDWTKGEHSRWLMKAQSMKCKCEEKGISVDDAIATFKLVKSL